MSGPTEMAERQGRILAELSELGLSLARDLHERALAAKTPEEAGRMAEALHRISRSVRQSLALEAKLQRDAGRDAREVRELEARETEARRATRKARLRKDVERLIWDEVEAPEIASEMARDVAHFVEREAESESFLDEPVEDQIARIRETMGVDEDWDLDDEADEDDDPDDEISPLAHSPPPSESPDDRPSGDWRSSA